MRRESATIRVAAQTRDAAHRVAADVLKRPARSDREAFEVLANAASTDALEHLADVFNARIRANTVATAIDTAMRFRDGAAVELSLRSGWTVSAGDDRLHLGYADAGLVADGLARRGRAIDRKPETTE